MNKNLFFLHVCTLKRMDSLFQIFKNEMQKYMKFWRLHGSYFVITDLRQRGQLLLADN